MRHSPLHQLLAHNTFLMLIVAFSLVSAVPVGDYLSHTRSGNTVDFNTGGTEKVRVGESVTVHTLVRPGGRE